MMCKGSLSPASDAACLMLMIVAADQKIITQGTDMVRQKDNAIGEIERLRAEEDSCQELSGSVVGSK